MKIGKYEYGKTAAMLKSYENVVIKLAKLNIEIFGSFVHCN